MYLLYVDESGDSGLVRSPAPHFVLSGFVIHELRWHQALSQIIMFRKNLKQRYGLKLSDEIHAHAFLHSPGLLSRIMKHDRLLILRKVLEFQASLADVNIINVVVDKTNKPTNYDVFEMAWKALLQRFHNTIQHGNFPGPRNPDDKGLVIADDTEGEKLKRMIRKLRRYNPVPHHPSYSSSGGYRQMPMDLIVEDPLHRDSAHTYFIQCCDVNAFSLYQNLRPNRYVRKKGARNWFSKLDPILCRVAALNDPQGVVRL